MPADLHARQLIDAGVDAFADSNYTLSVACLQEAKRIAPNAEIRNSARLCLASAYGLQHWPGVLTDPTEAAENERWLILAEQEYRELFADDPTPEQRATALRQIEAITSMRRFRDGGSKHAAPGHQ